MNKISQDTKLSNDKKKALRDVELQKLYVATGNAKAAGAVEQIQASLDEGVRPSCITPRLHLKCLNMEICSTGGCYSLQELFHDAWSGFS